jgi:hypothetical protein
VSRLIGARYDIGAFEWSPIYVDKDATGANNGASWKDAYTTVQAALDWTNAHPTTIHEIWVAEGVYYPDEGGSHVNNAVTETFRINYNNVQLYGGFAATETLRSARDWTAHSTALSGDVDGNDANADGNYIAETWNDIAGANAYHVLYLNGVRRLLRRQQPDADRCRLQWQLGSLGRRDVQRWRQLRR